MSAIQLPMDVEAIKRILPHRDPFLFVDRVIELTENNIVAIKYVRADEPFFKGHFPQKAVMPGVLMIEALAQAGGIMMLVKPDFRGKIAFLTAVDNARFRRIVSPGEELRLEFELTKARARLGLGHGVAKVGSEVACEADIMFSLAD